MGNEPRKSVFGGVQAMLDGLEELYRQVHRRPELPMEEERTAALAAERLRTAGFEVTTGVETLIAGACAWLGEPAGSG